ncbi:Outer membrane protein assembly factor BamB, contains PQQ-like beta-propeller repeat [Pedobacter suwonensis]|uniref:Outer membrane protein assembly factor BamB, contains PQQ-like beta-propeller repeat n=1 Tax=Pedobacter suwonensis TaxID=332999 RepID=A0A1I0SP17_9SPHI|nr:PQQ-binding-like beta-propeller repeat protein [Pedobacter suwonensis]SFA41255.1 Outer membrane protein assembly factor BamB, contains PQQ-like beta-propeller repeat [Pedobacter suwonensis]
MKVPSALLLCLLLVGLLSCKKIDDSLNLTPFDFEVSVTYRGETSAELTWEPAVDPDGDAVSYSVELNGRLVAQNIIKTSFTISDLLAGETYQGKVIATDPKGAKSATNFTVFPFQEQLLLFGRNLGLASYNIDGQKAWRSLPQMSVTPAVSNDTAFVNDGSTLYAISLKDGSKLWQNFPYVINDGRAITYANGILFFSTYLKTHAVDSRNGNLLWTVPYTFVVREVIVSKGIAYISSAQKLMAIDIKTGTQKWSATSAEGLFSSLAIRNGVVYALSSSSSNMPGSLYAFNASSGTIKWRYTFTGSSLNIENSSAIAIFGNRIYIPVCSNISGLSEQVHHLHAVDVTTGALVWKKAIATYEDITSIQSDENGIYFCTLAQLTKLDKNNGNVIWSIQSEFNRLFTLANDRIYVPVKPFLTHTIVYDTTTGKMVKDINTVFEVINSPVVIKNKKTYYPVSKSAMSAME